MGIKETDKHVRHNYKCEPLKNSVQTDNAFADQGNTGCYRWNKPLAQMK